METNLTPTLADPRLHKRYYIEITPFRRVAIPLLDMLFHTFSQMHFIGIENFPPKGPVVLAANHLTNFDVFPLQFALPRPIFFMGKAELFQNPLLDLGLRQLGGFPVVRGAHDDWALAHARRVLERGQVLGIFPEGTRSKGKGLRSAKTGAARLAIEAECPVVPLAVYGTHRLFSRIPRRTAITIRAGKPIWPERGDTALAFTDTIMFALADLLPPELRGVYTRKPKGFSVEKRAE